MSGERSEDFEVRLQGLAFPECPRWHDGRLWFSDMHAGSVHRLDAEGNVEHVVDVPGGPGGIGWLPDGRLLVVSMRDRKILRLDPDGLQVHADLASYGEGNANDMVVDSLGRAYVGNYGFDADAGEDEKPTSLLLVEPKGRVHVVAEALHFPNGMVISDDGRTLIVAESYAQRLTAFDIEADGWLTNARVWADLRPNVPDGICLDAEGAVWIADPVFHQVFRVVEGGNVTDAYALGDRGAFACMLGGGERTVLYVCTAHSSDPAQTITEKGGCIEAHPTSVPGAGLP